MSTKKRDSLIIVDIQPEYCNDRYYCRAGHLFSEYLGRFANFLNAAPSYYKHIHFLFNGHETLGMVTKASLINWLVDDVGVDPEIIESISFYEKFYAFFASSLCFIDLTSSKYIRLVKYMLKHNISDSRELPSSFWSHTDAETKDCLLGNHGTQDNHDPIVIPEVLDYLRDKVRPGTIDLIGGSHFACLREIEYCLKVLGRRYNKIDSLVY